MTAVNFPNSPSNGDTVTVGGVTYTYNSTKSYWDASTAGTSFDPSTVASHVIPSVDDTYDLGSPSKKWRSIYVDAGTIHIGSQTIKATSSGIQLPEVTIGTGTTTIKLGVDASGNLKQTPTVSGTAGSEVQTVSLTDLSATTASAGTAGLAYNNTTGAFTYTPTDISAKADLAGPALTGTPTAPTASASTNSTQIATTAYADSAVAALVASAPASLDTLNEIAAALGNDAALNTTLTNSIALKAPLASPTFTGVPVSTTPATSDDSTKIATTAYVVAKVGAAGGATTLNGLTDVNTSGVSTGQVLSYTGSGWGVADAGSGGSGGSIDLVADGAIAAGKAVTIEAGTGKVKQVAGSSVNYGTELALEGVTSANTAFWAARGLGSSFSWALAKGIHSYVETGTYTKVHLVLSGRFNDGSTNTYSIYHIMGVANGVDVTWGNATLVHSFGAGLGAGVHVMASEGKITIVSKDESDDKIFFYFGMHSGGTTATFGSIQKSNRTAYYPASNTQGYGDMAHRIWYHNDSRRSFFVGWPASGSQTGFVLYLDRNANDNDASGSFGEYNLSGELRSECSSKLTIKDANNAYHWMGTVSDNGGGSSVTNTLNYSYWDGSTWTGNNTSTAHGYGNGQWSIGQVEYDVTNDRYGYFLMSGAVTTSSLSWKTFTMSGTGITWNTTAQSGIRSYLFSRSLGTTYDTFDNKIVLSYQARPGGSGSIYQYARPLSLGSATSTTLGTEVSPVRITDGMGAIGEYAAQQVIGAYAAGKYAQHHGDYMGGGIYYFNTYSTAGVAQTTADQWIGINTTAKTDGQTATITLPGGINENQSGMTIEGAYYVQNDGDITTAVTDYKAGIALTAGKILVDDNTVNGATNLSAYATTSALTTGLVAKAPLASPTFTGTPAAPTAAVGTNTTQVATTAFVTAATAGSGGSGGSIDLVADGAIAAGKAVTIEAGTGKVKQIVATTSNFSAHGYKYSIGRGISTIFGNTTTSNSDPHSDMYYDDNIDRIIYLTAQGKVGAGEINDSTGAVTWTNNLTLPTSLGGNVYNSRAKGFYNSTLNRSIVVGYDYTTDTLEAMQYTMGPSSSTQNVSAVLLTGSDAVDWNTGETFRIYPITGTNKFILLYLGTSYAARLNIVEATASGFTVGTAITPTSDNQRTV